MVYTVSFYVYEIVSRFWSYNMFSILICFYKQKNVYIWDFSLHSRRILVPTFTLLNCSRRSTYIDFIQTSFANNLFSSWPQSLLTQNFLTINIIDNIDICICVFLRGKQLYTMVNCTFSLLYNLYFNLFTEMYLLCRTSSALRYI